jgi:hypothetical protein
MVDGGVFTRSCFSLGMAENGYASSLLTNWTYAAQVLKACPYLRKLVEGLRRTEFADSIENWD